MPGGCNSSTGRCLPLLPNAARCSRSACSLMPCDSIQPLPVARTSLLQAVKHHLAHQVHRWLLASEEAELVGGLPHEHGVAGHDPAPSSSCLPAAGGAGRLGGNVGCPSVRGTRGVAACHQKTGLQRAAAARQLSCQRCGAAKRCEPAPQFLGSITWRPMHGTCACLGGPMAACGGDLPEQAGVQRRVHGVKHQLVASQRLGRHGGLALLRAQARHSAVQHVRKCPRSRQACFAPGCQCRGLQASISSQAVPLISVQSAHIQLLPVRVQLGQEHIVCGTAQACLRVHAHRGCVDQHVAAHSAAGKLRKAACLSRRAQLKKGGALS